MDKYQKLFEPVKFVNGVETNNRFALAPMVAFDANEDQEITESHLDYIRRRNNVGGLLITGAQAICKGGSVAATGLGAYDDDKIPGMKLYARAMKENGNLAVAQIIHGGRQATDGFARVGRTVAPTSMNFPFLPYVPEEMTEEEIQQAIKDYGQAARRVAEAGFDGVEIHGANHYLLQQFFSSYSNHRDDNWGGDFERRMNFPIAVLKEVRRVVKEMGNDDFIIGYRISPEEVHGDNIGYTIDDALVLIDKLVDIGVDYIHVSMFGPLSYKAVAQAGNQSEPMNALIHKTIDGRCPLVIVGGMYNADDALDSLHYGDIIAMGSGALAEPDFAAKIKAGRLDDINFDVTGRQEDLKIPEKLIYAYNVDKLAFPPVQGIETFELK